MAVLTTQQRKTLEDTVKDARNIAERGARNALQGLAIDHTEPFAHMSPEQRKLRNALRSKARLLGDTLEANGEQNIDHLSYELAYETWHKMLFARFLEANNLLMHHSGIAVSLTDCEELAVDENYVDKWEAAASYASKMLPAIFRVEDPLMQVIFATNDRIKFEEIIDALETDIFIADDSLGWVYQFWQSEAKAVINASGDKIDGEKLPAVTQLFTEPYMVNFLIDNTLGAWWVNRNPGKTPPVKFEYLRTLENGSPAAGNFEGWPDNTAEVTSLDPCMGSGHFVASLFPVFTSLRMLEEGLTKEQATDKVITENLHGLELDARCTQIAAFNLALTAWKFCGKYKELPEMNLACSGIAPKGKKENWVKLVGKGIRFEDKERMENGMRALYDHFQLAPELGSLLDPTTIKADTFTASFEELQPVLKKALESEIDNEQLERVVLAAGIAKAGDLLSKKYTLQITNVPYLGKKKQDKVLSDYVSNNFPEAKADLATVFFERLFKTAKLGGSICSVMPQNWLFLTTYKYYRRSFLKNKSWNFVIRLGEHAFENAEAAGAFACMVAISKKIPAKEHSFFGINAANNRGEKPIYALEKQELIKSTKLKLFKQKDQLENPDSRVVIDDVQYGVDLLEKFAISVQGTMPSDRNRLVFNFWEYLVITQNEVFMHGSSTSKDSYNGMTQIFKLELFKRIYKEIGGRFQGKKAWNKRGMVVSIMSMLPISIYNGDIFDGNVHAISPIKSEYFPAIYSYALDPTFLEEIRKIDQKVSVTCATIAKIPFDLAHWQKVADKKFPNGLPKPYSDDPTQWLFHGHPIKTDNPLQVATARLLGYRWPAESDEEMELADEAKALIEEVKAFDSFTDDDGIFCIPSVNAEQAGADRLREYLQTVFGSEYNNKTINELLEKEGAKASNLEDWFRNEFFVQHCKVFNNRPFIWHIWDGRKDGFSALVNYHKLDKENFSKLIYTYLGDWIRMCDAKKKAGESGADGLLDAAKKLQEKLMLILQGEAPYDIFVRWKSLKEQPMGWEPDLNDGVRLNVRPFAEAGVLRSKFNVKWGIDRGKNPAGSHWGEKRDNDLHFTLEERRIARE